MDITAVEILHLLFLRAGFPGGLVIKNPLNNGGDSGSVRSPGVENGNSPSILAWEIP